MHRAGQYDKTLAFELAAHKYINALLCPDASYFSVLQHLWELQIAEVFCRERKHLPVFISCNEHVGLAHARRVRDSERLDQGDDSRRCGRCAKCEFVFTLLSAHFHPGEAQNVFLVGRVYSVLRRTMCMSRWVHVPLP